MTETEHGVAAQILRYFLDRPDAAESLEGIARWRQPDGGGPGKFEQATAAVDRLVAQGLLLETRAANGGRLLRLDGARRHEAERAAGSCSAPRPK